MSKTARGRREKLLTEAEGYLALEMPEHALASLRQIEDPGPAVAKVNFLKGDALRALGRHDEALAALNRAFAEDPDNVPLLFAMAWCYKRIGQLPRAITAMEQAYRIAPKQAVILYNLACYWSLAGNKTQALSWLGRSLRMDASLRKLIDDETDFDPLRGDPDFRMIVGALDEMQRPA
jgi:tetratricopeptide (TPR) repeat protein